MKKGEEEEEEEEEKKWDFDAWEELNYTTNGSNGQLKLCMWIV
jgi:hypothetical protein